jgi:hypothetical protein
LDFLEQRATIWIFVAAFMMPILYAILPELSFQDPTMLGAYAFFAGAVL